MFPTLSVSNAGKGAECEAPVAPFIEEQNACSLFAKGPSDQSAELNNIGLVKSVSIGSWDGNDNLPADEEDLQKPNAAQGWENSLGDDPDCSINLNEVVYSMCSSPMTVAQVDQALGSSEEDSGADGVENEVEKLLEQELQQFVNKDSSKGDSGADGGENKVDKLIEEMLDDVLAKAEDLGAPWPCKDALISLTKAVSKVLPKDMLQKKNHNHTELLRK